MQVKRVPVKVQDYEKVVHIDNSASHWALEHTKFASAARRALATFEDLTSAKNQAVTEIIKAAGAASDMGRVVQARLVKDEKGDAFVEIMLNDEAAPEPEAAPAAAPEAAPAAPAS